MPHVERLASALWRCVRALYSRRIVAPGSARCLTGRHRDAVALPRSDTYVTTMTNVPQKRAGVGRPPKFQEASRPITVTLPERVLKALESVSGDRAEAIVKCVEAVVGKGSDVLPAVELIEVIPGKALIVVGPSRLLKQTGWLRMAEIGPARYLLVLPSGTPVETLEVGIQDLIERLTPDEEGERRILSELRALLADQRRQKMVSKAELVFVDLPSKAHPAGV